MNRAGSSTKEA